MSAFAPPTPQPKPRGVIAHGLDQAARRHRARRLLPALRLCRGARPGSVHAGSGAFAHQFEDDLTRTACKLAAVGAAGRFEGALVVRVECPGQKRWTLSQDLLYHLGGYVFRIPEGVGTDFASVPWYLRPFCIADTLTAWGAVLHDWLYRIQTVPRVVADALLYAAMVAAGCTRRWAWTFYISVRAFGWKAWNKHARNKQESRDA